ncbi:MAG: 4-hydroxyphenylpyruvate dioxygenase [Bradymonadaceae bacterium]
MMTDTNFLKMKGIEFVEWTSPQPGKLDELFGGLGFSRLGQYPGKAIDFYRQNAIKFILNREEGDFSAHFRETHGPSICSMGVRVEDAQFAFEEAVRRGARPYDAQTAKAKSIHAYPAIYGIGDSLVYFLDEAVEDQFEAHPEPREVDDKGFLLIDHLTNNVYKGQMARWSTFYQEVFGFQEIRYFDIKGQKTGLTSYALQSPCKTFCLPINEGNEAKSQIEEYLREYSGEGIQHIAFLADELLDSLDELEGTGIEFLDIMPEYYEDVFDRVPNVVESHKRIEDHNVLVDGDEEGYLLQIFTQNIVGPIFIELIQRKNHHSFGEGNFKALFESIERDQARRGVL